MTMFAYTTLAVHLSEATAAQAREIMKRRGAGKSIFVRHAIKMLQELPDNFAATSRKKQIRVGINMPYVLGHELEKECARVGYNKAEAVRLAIEEMADEDGML